jgi:hypothetical protein
MTCLRYSPTSEEISVFMGMSRKELVLYNSGYPSCVEDATKGNALEQAIHISMCNILCSSIHFGCCFQYKKWDPGVWITVAKIPELSTLRTSATRGLNQQVMLPEDTFSMKPMKQLSLQVAQLTTRQWDPGIFKLALEKIHAGLGLLYRVYSTVAPMLQHSPLLILADVTLNGIMVNLILQTSNVKLLRSEFDEQRCELTASDQSPSFEDLNCWNGRFSIFWGDMWT